MVDVCVTLVECSYLPLEQLYKTLNNNTEITLDYSRTNNVKFIDAI